MSIIDAQERLTALDPLRSFCVGAPAGSGKTELLIQRYLTLLARVRSPEQILAITFTRKAAAEMRERVLEALVGARSEQPCGGQHQQHTRQLALAALAADDRGNWQLVRNIARLNIKTIDSFCGQLTRQMPVLSEFGGQAEVIDNAHELYREAVSELFKVIESDDPLGVHLAALMLHFDNDWGRLQDLLSAMLGRRDQWYAYIGIHHQADEAEAYLLQTVNAIVVDALEQLSADLGPYSEDLLALEQYATGNLGATTPTQFPTPKAEDLARWRALRSLLLTADKKGKWRATLNKNMGFPAGKGAPQERKEQLTQIIAELSSIDGLLEALAAVPVLPEITAQSESWQLALHLSRILPRLAAELLLVFQRHGQVDHGQVSLSALQALGDDELPTELALRLDYQLEHILVDEFQDTAINQYELVRRLTRGWGEHNQRNLDAPRTLLVVGDGMQSIYGFRDANVGLFLKARQEGFNGVALEYIALHSNFRSDEGIVRWVNATFADAFPATEDVSRGQIRFTEAAAVRPAGLQTAVSLRGFTGETPAVLEVEAICKEVQRAIDTEDCRSIALLARTRGHLQPILARLKELGIEYSAQDIDALASSSVIMDLLSLCRALSNPADRLAWMAILRAPWCGLTLSDLHLIVGAGGGSAYAPMSELLADKSTAQQLSDSGRERLLHLVAVMGAAQQTCDRRSLRSWVEQLWLDLGGAATVATESQLQDAERFFHLLEQAELEGVGLSISWLLKKLEKLFVQAENPSSKVQVMTLHKAKGLEFDWVIIPSLEKMTRVNSRPLLLWDDHSRADGERGFLLAADDHCSDDEPTLYNWLKAQRASKEVLEMTRLLYVGTTRAVHRLMLTACVNYDSKKEQCRPPPARSLLASIWKNFHEQMALQESVIAAQSKAVDTPQRPLHRLTQHSIAVLSAAGPPGATAAREPASNRPLRIFNRVDRYVGTVVHLAMEQLSRQAVLSPDISPQAKLSWRRALASLGLYGDLLETACARVFASVSAVLADEQGRWVLSCDHAEAHSEMPLVVVQEDSGVKEIIIDRTFVDVKTGERWLVDYKNSEPMDGELLEDFLRREAESYRPQLALYREALAQLGGQTVISALYFTALPHLHRVDI